MPVGGLMRCGRDMRPRLSYCVFGVQRSGSSLLCECLKATGLAGAPEEFFMAWEDGPWAQAQGVATRHEFLAKVLEKGTTPNGIFGIKIMWNYFCEIVAKLQQLPEYAGVPQERLLQTLFPNLHCIWMIRRDNVRQAVSWAKAIQTGIYASYQIEYQKPRQKPTFDFRLIDNLLNVILQGELGWANYFRQCGVEPFKVFYEDFTASCESKTADVLRHLGLDVPSDLKIGKLALQKQADAVNEEWVVKYRALKAAEPCG